MRLKKGRRCSSLVILRPEYQPAYNSTPPTVHLPRHGDQEDIDDIYSTEKADLIGGIARKDGNGNKTFPKLCSINVLEVNRKDASVLVEGHKTSGWIPRGLRIPLSMTSACRHLPSSHPPAIANSVTSVV